MFYYPWNGKSGGEFFMHYGERCDHLFDLAARNE